MRLPSDGVLFVVEVSVEHGLASRRSIQLSVFFISVFVCVPLEYGYSGGLTLFFASRLLQKFLNVHACVSKIE